MMEPSKNFAVLGDPIAHSLSPVMHAAAFARMGLSHRYIAIHTSPAQLPEALQAVRALGFSGINLTVPHKQAGYALANKHTREARDIGAVNTLKFTNDGITLGHNTDGPGFIRALAQLPVDSVEHVVVLGAGGGALAILYALTTRYPTANITWVSRAEQLERFGQRTVSYAKWLAEPRPMDLLINTTTVGMPGGPAWFPSEIPWLRFRSGAAVIDLVYPRVIGGLLDQAEQRGFATQDGRELLVQQGVLALEFWLDQVVPGDAVVAMRKAVDADASGC